MYLCGVQIAEVACACKVKYFINSVESTLQFLAVIKPLALRKAFKLCYNLYSILQPKLGIFKNISKFMRDWTDPVDHPAFC